MIAREVLDKDFGGVPKSVMNQSAVVNIMLL
jgi:hypothetical protein